MGIAFTSILLYFQTVPKCNYTFMNRLVDLFHPLYIVKISIKISYLCLTSFKIFTTILDFHSLSILMLTSTIQIYITTHS